MNKILIIFITFLWYANASGQNVGIGTTNPAVSAKLEVSSTSQGFLPPRMTAAQRDAISNPNPGLVIYCIDCGSNGGELQVFNTASSWRNMTGGVASNPVALVIGIDYLGGKLAYVLQPGDPGFDINVPHGLIAAPTDRYAGLQWGCYQTPIYNARGKVIGTGNQNTINIISYITAYCTDTSYAAKYCADLILNGYSDWFLPSRDELNKLYINRVAIGGFASISNENPYWSSSELDGDFALTVDFGNFYSGQFRDYGKFAACRIRAIRTF